MKQILSLIFFCMFLVSCTNNIDKKIDLVEYEETIEKIKQENTEYTADDYSRASRLLNPLSFKAITSGTTKTDKTYRELLDEAKAKNEQENAVIKAYTDEIERIKSLLSVHVKQSEYISANSSVFSRDISKLDLEVEFKNTSTKNITGIDGVILVKNNVGDVIMKCFVKLSDISLLPVGETFCNKRSYYAVGGHDNILELEANKPETFKYDWLPKLIIFDDGTREEAPQEPIYLDANYK